MIQLLDKVLAWSFYLLFFFVPLVFFSGSFELFEYNKMMLTYAFTLVIGCTWAIKILVTKHLNFSRTFLDIPIALYIGSHIISTVLSIDPHTSLWGYYSRFHEGLIATLCYVLLYYAAVANLKRQDVINIFLSSFISGAIASLWGVLEHFGSSPSCLFITGKGDVSCWIQDVQSRVFATLGQPNWLAAYLDVLILIILGFVVNLKIQAKVSLLTALWLLAPILYFATLLFTKSRSGILGVLIGLAVFGACYLLIHQKTLELKKLATKPILILVSAFVVLILIYGLPFVQTQNFSLEKVMSTKSIQTAIQQPVDPNTGITESGAIRNIVWSGALKVWQRYPLFGSGVETFGYAYYKDRPVEHNLVSEWDFLYNKAHNEFLNILATTGLVGILAYLSLVVGFAIWFIKLLLKSSSSISDKILVSGLAAAYISILVTNFFGFSVVIIGLFFFLVPAFSFVLTKSPDSKPALAKPLTIWSWSGIGLLAIIGLLGLFKLLSMWQADKAFAYGKNLDGANLYQNAYQYLVDAVAASPDEPTFRDELAYNQSVLALSFYQQASESAEAKLLTTEAIKNSDQVLAQSPNILAFWKTRTRLFYNLANIDKRYLFEALNAIRKAAELAPTDAKVNYNLGLLLGQTGDINGGITVLKRTTQMKPDYSDAHYALGILYDQKGDKTKARKEMEYMQEKIGNDARSKKWLEENKN